MNGTKEYTEKIQKRIEHVLENNDKSLRGYYNFIGLDKTIKTRYDYICSVSLFLNQFKGNISDLVMDDFSEYISHLYDTMSSSYTIRVYSALNLFGQYLFASKRTSYNPMEYVKKPKYVETVNAVEKREIGFLNKKEIKEYKKYVSTGVGSNKAIKRQEKYKSRDMLIVMIFLNTGMRCSALMKLDVKDIDLINMRLLIPDKGNKLISYEIDESLMEYFNEWLCDREKILDGNDQDALFISNQKTRMDQSSIFRVVTKYAKNIKDKHITPHKLRATYGTQIYNETQDLYYTQDCMHHSSPKTTELYIRGNKGNTKIASQVMANLTR